MAIARTYLRPSVLLTIAVSMVAGRILLPAFDLSAQAAPIPTPAPCQAELDAMNAASAAVTAAAVDVAAALLDHQAAQGVWYECEFTTPGDCDTEAAQAAATEAALQAAQQSYATAQGDLTAAEYAYQVCLYGGGN